MMRDEDNYISVGQWMLLLLVPAIPVIGWILVIVSAAYILYFLQVRLFTV